MIFNNVIRMGDFPVVNTTARELAEHLLESQKFQRPVALFFANTNFVVKCRSLSARMCEQSVLIVNDGVGMDIAALLLQRGTFKENLNGTDFMPYFFLRSGRASRVFMVGGKPEVLRKAVDHVSRQLGQEVVGLCDGYDGIKNNPNLVEEINRSKAEVVLVALGNPIQEKWILDHRAALDTGVIIGVGALFDFWAGAKPRAPTLVQNLRLEWFYRLLLEPRRLLSRYTVGIFLFLFIVVNSRGGRG